MVTKVAELFAELGFKVEGKDDLKGFETSLQNIATAARDAMQALKALAGTRIPSVVAQRAVSVAPAVVQNTVPGAPPPPVVVQTAPQARYSPAPGVYGSVLHGPMAPPPLLSNAAAPAAPNSIMQGLKALGTLGLKVAGIATVAVVLKKLVSTLIEMIDSSRKAAVGMLQFTGQTGISRQVLKAWEFAGAQVGVTSEEIQGAFKNIQQNWERMKITGDGNLGAFSMMGIHPGDAPDDILQKFGAKSKDLSEATAVYMGSLLGIPDKIVVMMREMKGKVPKIDPALMLTKDEQAGVLRLNGALETLKLNFGLLGDKITADVAPALNTILGYLNQAAQLLTASSGARKIATDVLTGNTLGAVYDIGKYALGSKGTGKNMTVNVTHNTDIDASGGGSPQDQARRTVQLQQREFNKAYYGTAIPAQVGP